MRTFIIAVVVLTVILASITGYYLYCDKTVKNLQSLALSEGIVTADGANKIFSYWEKHRFALHLGVDTSTIKDIDTQLLSLRAAISSGSEENTVEAIELLRYELIELRKANSLSLENIL